MTSNAGSPDQAVKTEPANQQHQHQLQQQTLQNHSSQTPGESQSDSPNFLATSTTASGQNTPNGLSLRSSYSASVGNLVNLAPKVSSTAPTHHSRLALSLKDELHESHESGSDAEHSRNFWRPVRACTHCRQQKIRCDAAETQPLPCSKCAKSGKECIVDPNFRPKKGGQVMHLREDIKRLRHELQRLQGGGGSRHGAHNGSSHNGGLSSSTGSHLETDTEDSCHEISPAPSEDSMRTPHSPHQPRPQKRARHSPELAQGLPAHVSTGGGASTRSASQGLEPTHTGAAPRSVHAMEQQQQQRQQQQQQPPVCIGGPWRLESVVLTTTRAWQLHKVFVEQYLDYLPIMETHSPEELYGQSETLFWAVMVTAALSDETPELYLSLQEPMKRLIGKVTFLDTPRSTHIVQALLVLAMWPLQNEKMLDDSSYRYVNLARCLGMQLGTHRGRFIYEFSRKQKLMPNAVKWRTRTWVATYVCEQISSSSLGVPSTMPLDYLVNKASVEHDWLSEEFCGILRIAIYYAKITSIMGSGISTPDGLLSAREREPMIVVLQHSLGQLAERLPLHRPSIEIAFLYVQCMLCSYAFLPDTPEDVQNPKIVEVYGHATKLVTVMRAYVGTRRITEFPAYIRHAASFAAMLLLRLHVMPQFPANAVESARQSIVTVHYLYRNVHPAWLQVHNDVTRIAKVLESLNYVLATQPQLLTTSRMVLSRMRSHLTFSLFYELLWVIHESRRLNKLGLTSSPGTQQVSLPLQPQQQQQQQQQQQFPNRTLAQTLPLFTNINSDEYTTSTYTSPDGTTLTMLVPTSNSNKTTIQQRAGIVAGLNAQASALINAGTREGLRTPEQSLRPLLTTSNQKNSSGAGSASANSSASGHGTFRQTHRYTNSNNSNSTGSSRIYPSGQAGTSSPGLCSAGSERSSPCPGQTQQRQRFASMAPAPPQSNSMHTNALLSSNGGGPEDISSTPLSSSLGADVGVGADSMIPTAAFTNIDTTNVAMNPDDVVAPRADLAQLEALFAGVDWMNHEGDDFLGWMPLAGEFPM